MGFYRSGELLSYGGRPSISSITGHILIQLIFFATAAFSVRQHFYIFFGLGFRFHGVCIDQAAPGVFFKDRVYVLECLMWRRKWSHDLRVPCDEVQLYSRRPVKTRANL